MECVTHSETGQFPSKIGKKNENVQTFLPRDPFVTTSLRENIRQAGLMWEK